MPALWASKSPSVGAPNGPEKQQPLHSSGMSGTPSYSRPGARVLSSPQVQGTGHLGILVQCREGVCQDSRSPHAFPEIFAVAASSLPPLPAREEQGWDGWGRRFQNQMRPVHEPARPLSATKAQPTAVIRKA